MDDPEPVDDPEQVDDPEPHEPGPAVGASPSATLARRLATDVTAAVARVVVGSEELVHDCLAAALAGGHVLLEGPPGLAKTLLVRSLAQVVGGDFARIQFTPDLMPADVSGTSVFHPGEGDFRFRAGPIFGNVVLCDEINRAPAKTQSALLEAMQERCVTVDGQTTALPRPFTVFATMNPIEHEGTYPLPEAQLDRFLFKLLVDYPAEEVERELLRVAHARRPGASPAELGLAPVTTLDELRASMQAVDEVAVRDDLCDYVVRLLRATREDPSLAFGASPRAGVMLLRAAKAVALLAGRDYVTPDDLKRIVPAALRHRVGLDPAEEIEGVRPDDVLRRILDSVEVPR